MLVSCISMTYFFDNCSFSYHIFNLNCVGNFCLLILLFGIGTMCLQCVKTHVTGSGSTGLPIYNFMTHRQLTAEEKGNQRQLTAKEY